MSEFKTLFLGPLHVTFHSIPIPIPITTCNVGSCILSLVNQAKLSHFTYLLTYLPTSFSHSPQLRLKLKLQTPG